MKRALVLALVLGALAACASEPQKPPQQQPPPEEQGEYRVHKIPRPGSQRAPIYQLAGTWPRRLTPSEKDAPEWLLHSEQDVKTEDMGNEWVVGYQAVGRDRVLKVAAVEYVSPAQAAEVYAGAQKHLVGAKPLTVERAEQACAGTIAVGEPGADPVPHAFEFVLVGKFFFAFDRASAAGADPAIVSEVVRSCLATLMPTTPPADTAAVGS